MTGELLREILIWCAVVNYGILLWWFLVFVYAHGWMHRLHTRWFRISAEQFDAIHYTAMAFYKIGILLFIVVPYIALYIVSRHGS
jgi:hypothetical protein